MRQTHSLPRRHITYVLGGLILFSAALSAATINGGSTTVTFDPSFIQTVVSAGFTVAPIAPATADLASMPATATFPITGGDTTANIDHSGGLSFTKGGTTADLQNFIINIPNANLTGEVSVGATSFPNVTLFDVNLSNGALTVDAALASDINSVFGVSGLAGASVGTATINAVTSAAPEPASFALLAFGMLGAAAVFKKRVVR